MPTPINFLSSPLDMVDSLFEFHRGEKSIEEVKQIVQKQFQAEFNDRKMYFKIPSINVKTNSYLKPNSLVRFRCMIQDMKDPEFFRPFVKIEHKNKPGFDIRCGLYRDTIDCSLECEVLPIDDEKSTLERHLFNCVPIPGETFWVKNYWFNVEKEDDLISLPQQRQEANVAMGEKRERDNDDENDKMESCDESQVPSKKIRVENETISSNLPTEHVDSCLVKVYNDGDTFKLNDMVEFVGIYTQNVEDGLHSETPGATAVAEPKFQLHVLSARKLNHSNPKLYEEQSNSEESLVAKSFAVKEIREKLHKYLTVHLMGDELAAEFLICHLISFVTHKDAMPLGKYALNLYNVPSDAFVKNLYDTLCHLLTKCVYLPLSLADLNVQKFLPKKDYENNCLTTGRLQLSNGTHLIIDETKLEAGQLIDQGVRNIAALQSVISNQKLDYDFHYHSVEFRTDFNVLILSEGLSCLPSDCALPMQVSFTPANFSVGQTDESLLGCFRDYLTLVRFPEFKIDEPMQQKIREDFVEMRRKNDEVSQMKLHELLVLARWISFSYGKSSLNDEYWERAKSMDESRRRRVITK